MDVVKFLNTFNFLAYYALTCALTALGGWFVAIVGGNNVLETIMLMLAGPLIYIMSIHFLSEAAAEYNQVYAWRKAANKARLKMNKLTR